MGSSKDSNVMLWNCIALVFIAMSTINLMMTRQFHSDIKGMSSDIMSIRQIIAVTSEDHARLIKAIGDIEVIRRDFYQMKLTVNSMMTEDQKANAVKAKW